MTTTAATSWTLMGSAPSLESLFDMMKGRMSWRPERVDDDGGLWLEGRDAPMAGVRVIRKGKRYRLEFTA